MSNTKDFDSIFSPKKKIDIASHITELVLNNKIEWKNKKQGRDSRPRCDFWKKEKADSNSDFKQLQNDFRLEVTYIKNLLKVFSSVTVLQYVKDRGIITFRYLPLDKQKTVMYNLFQSEVKKIKEDNKAKSNRKTPQLNLNYSSRKSKKSKVSDL